MCFEIISARNTNFLVSLLATTLEVTGTATDQSDTYDFLSSC